MFCSMYVFVSETLSLNLCHCFLRWGYLILQNFRETQKGTWYHRTFEERGEIRKIKIHYLHVHKPWTWKKDKVHPVPQRNEMLSLHCTALGFVSKNKEHNPE